MVATRRGVRVIPASKTDSDPVTAAQATQSTSQTPSSARRTRSAAKPESPTQNTVVEASAQLQKISEADAPPASARKRCTRASRLHSPDKPCTPVSSVHEGDISDLESCCSAVSDIEPPVTRRSTRRPPRRVNKEEDVSEVESCSSVVSASKVRRSTRKKAIPGASDSASEAKDDKAEPEATPQRNKRATRAASRQLIEDSEVSDADSVTGDASKPSLRRSTRARRTTDVDEPLESSQSPAPTTRRTRASRSKAETASDVPMSCDSEGFESGPYYSRATRGRRVSQLKVTDSDSDLTDVGKGTPCSSRTGSGSSNRIEEVSEMSPRGVRIVLAKVIASPEQEESMNDSRLESTVIQKDAECTFTEENEEKEERNSTETKQEDEPPLEKSTAEESSIISHDEIKTDAECTFTEENEEKEERNPTETKQEDEPPLEKSTAEESSIISHDESALEKAPVDEPAVITVDHQEELPAESMVKEASEMETMQETVQAPEPSKPLQSALVNKTTSDSQITDNRDEDMEVAIIADTDTVDEQHQEDGDVEMMGGEETEATSVSGEAQQVVEPIQVSEIEEAQEEPIQATSSQQFSEQPPQGTVTQSKTAVSFLDSSEDEDDEDDDFADESRVSSGDEEVEDLEGNEETVQSSKTEVTKSVEGLFMIDTRPGEEVDEQYYHDGQREDRAVQEEAAEEEEDEEFVDEEGESDDDDAADVLFSSRNPQAKGMSSRIDPGIRMKELGGLYISFDGSKSKPVSGSQQKTKGNKIQDEVMKKSVIGPDFEKKEAVPPYKESKHALKLKHRTERAKTTGDSWFNMKAPEITPELKGDLQLLRMRGSMDSKRFYKKNDRDGFPKYFQMGTVVDNPVDFYHSRVSKKDRKRTMVEELLTDAEFRQSNKKKFHAIVAEKAAQAAGRRHKKKNKFHNKK